MGGKSKLIIYHLAFSILLLLGVSLGIRLWRVTEAPATVNWDEAAVGYNAYSLLKTGRDEFGKPMPVSLRSFDDYKPALYSYFSVIPVAVLGLGEFATRLTSAIWGTIVVFAVLYITSKMSKNWGLGLAAGAFVSVSPWALHFSRIAFEANLAVGIYFLAIALFVYSLKNERAFFWSAAGFILSMYAYHAQRAIALPTLFGLMWLFKKRIALKPSLWAGLLLIPLVYSFLTEPAGSRLASTIIFKLWPFVPADFGQTIFNPIFTLVWQAVGQFLAYFSPATIFVRGSNEPILRIPTLGLLPLELLPLWVVGLVRLFRKNNLNKILWVILILAPLPAVITWNWFSVVRTLAIYPAFAILAALGLKSLGLPKLLRIGFWGLFGLSSLYTILTIGVYAPHETYGEFQPGFEEMVPYVMDKAGRYDEVVVDTGQAAPYIFFLFYGKYPPEQYQKEARRDLKHTENHGYVFGKFNFRKLEDYELYAKDKLLVGQTFRLPEYEIENVKKDRPINVRDFYDKGGYISLRVVEL